MKKIQNESYKIARISVLELRKQSGLSQLELSRILGLDQSVISKIERGERRLDIVEFIYYCGALKVSPSEAIEKIKQRIGEGR